MDSFHILLNHAQEGDLQAIEQILFLYKPLIDRHSWINSKFNEDLQ
jgi:hypothetical protein